MKKFLAVILAVLLIIPLCSFAWGLQIVFVSTSDFASLDELNIFLANDKSSEVVYLTVVDGKASLTGICEHRAFKLRDNAAKLGKRLETEIITREECAKFGVGHNTTQAHMLVKAIIKNDVYYIEPSNDKVWLAYWLD